MLMRTPLAFVIERGMATISMRLPVARSWFGLWEVGKGWIGTDLQLELLQNGLLKGQIFFILERGHHYSWKKKRRIRWSMTSWKTSFSKGTDETA
jgi:hypothetical protein